MAKEIAVIFDMDGVLVNNSAFHDEAWALTCALHGKPKTSEEIRSIFGGTNKIFVEKLLNISEPAMAEQIAIEKEALYRSIFEAHMVAPEGLMALLSELKKHNVAIAVGTSAPKVNLDFVLDKLNIRSFFDVLVYESMVTKGKPDPEIYTVAAEKLNIEASRCVVIEDSVLGIDAALAAKMKVIGITTTFPGSAIAHAHCVIDNFSALNYASVSKIIN